jgi:hypothetical protein
MKASSPTWSGDGESLRGAGSVGRYARTDYPLDPPITTLPLVTSSPPRGLSDVDEAVAVTPRLGVGRRRRLGPTSHQRSAET